MKSISRRQFGIIAILTVSTFFALKPSPSSPQQVLTILHTSEHHGTVFPNQEAGRAVGGMARRASLIASVRSQTNNLLVIDSGDILIGTALSSAFRGEPDILAMSLMGYHAMAAGNHEFDFGLQHVRRLSELARFPILCSNLLFRGTTDPPCRRSAVHRAGDITIGLIGLLGRSNFPDTFSREAARSLDLRDPVETARTLAHALRTDEHVDLVVAITHQQTDEDIALLRQVEEVDVVIGGHTEGFDGLRSARAGPPVAELVNPGPVFVKTHRLGRTVGRLDVSIEREPDGRATVVAAKAWNLPVTDDLPPEASVVALVESYRDKLQQASTSIVGTSLVTLDGEHSRIRTRETNLGNLLADLLRTAFDTDVAFINSGQIRDSLPAGALDMEHVLKVLPFGSSTVTFSITGRELLQALENSVSLLPGASGRFLQVSGLTVAYDVSSPPGSRVREVFVRGRALDPAHRYSATTDAFIADGGDGYTMFAHAHQRMDRQIPLRDLLLAALRDGPVTASVDGRIRFAPRTK